MDVACSTLCFTREPLSRALRHIAELEFSKVDLGIFEGSPHVTPQQVLADVSAVVQQIRQGPTIAFAAITARLSASGDELDAQIDALSHLAKQLTTPILVIEAAATGTPIEEEIQRITRLVKIASIHGVNLSVVTKSGTLTEDPDVAVQLCKDVAELSLTLDPSHYVCGPHQGKSFDQVFPVVRHVQLRDSGRRMDQLQVKVGRGEIEYGRIVTSLARYKYRGSLVVAIEDILPADMDVETEVRKLGLVLESLL